MIGRVLTFGSLSDRLADWIAALPPVERRRHASAMIIWAAVLWVASHVGNVVLPPWFFEHVLLAISWGAILATGVDVVQTTDVRVAEEESTPET